MSYSINKEQWAFSRSSHSSPGHDITSIMLEWWACMFLIRRRYFLSSTLWLFHPFSRGYYWFQNFGISSVFSYHLWPSGSADSWFTSNIWIVRSSPLTCGGSCGCCWLLLSFIAFTLFDGQFNAWLLVYQVFLFSLTFLFTLDLKVMFSYKNTLGLSVLK